MKLFLIFACCLLATSSRAQGPEAKSGTGTQVQSGWPLEVEKVRTTLQNTPTMRELDLVQARIVTPPDFTTRTPNPQFEVRQIAGNPESEALFVTLRCRDRKTCGSFLTQIVLPNANLNPRIRTDLQTVQASSSSFHPATSVSALVQPRTPARLVIEGDGLRITELVFPERRARLGEIVRVNDPATHRSMLAKVTGPGLLCPAIEDKTHAMGAR